MSACSISLHSTCMYSTFFSSCITVLSYYHFFLLLTYRMSTMEDKLQACYGTQRIESDEDDELLGGRDDKDDENIDIIGDDVMVMSSKYEGNPASPPIGIREEEVVDYEYEHELDYDEMLDAEQGRPNPSNGKQRQVAHRSSVHALHVSSHICTHKCFFCDLKSVNLNMLVVYS